MEKARASGQAVSKNAAPGTFASGVQKVTEALPGLMSDLIHTAPDNQKEKISKLLDIWERGQTFPQALIADLKQQLKSPKNSKTNLRCGPHFILTMHYQTVILHRVALQKASPLFSLPQLKLTSSL
jgi:protein NRD1